MEEASKDLADYRSTRILWVDQMYVVSRFPSHSFPPSFLRSRSILGHDSQPGEFISVIVVLSAIRGRFSQPWASRDESVA